MEEIKTILKVVNDKLADNEFWLDFYTKENEQLKEENAKLKAEIKNYEEKPIDCEIPQKVASV